MPDLESEWAAERRRAAEVMAADVDPPEWLRGMPDEDALEAALLDAARQLGQCQHPGCNYVAGHEGDHAPDPSNPDDVPEVLRQPYPGHPKSPAYRREVKRKVKNRRWVKVVDMAEVLEKMVRASGIAVEELEIILPDDRWWRELAAAAGHPSSKPPSPETREAVVQKLRENLAGR